MFGTNRTRTNPQSDINGFSNSASLQTASDSEHLHLSGHQDIALRIASIYCVAATIWILTSDTLVDFVFSGGAAHQVQSFKGIAFVLVTAAVLFWILKSAQKRELSLAKRLRSAIDASRDGLWQWNLDRDKIVVTSGGDAELGWDSAETITNLDAWKSVVHPDDWPKVSDLMDSVSNNPEDDWLLEQRFKTVNGDWHWIEIKGHAASRSEDGSVEIMEGSYHSIDRLKRAQLALERKNRALSILVIAYDAMSSGRPNEECLKMLVQGIAGSDDCPVAWVGKAMDDEAKSIQPFAWAGQSSEFVRTATFRWDDSPYGLGPTGTCIKTGKPALFRDVQLDEAAAPHRDQLRKYGIRSAIAIPITTTDDQKYVLNISGNSPQQFSGEDLETYEMIAKVLKVMVGSADMAFQFGQSERARLEIGNRLQKAVMGVTAALATVVEKRDPYTAGHQQRVAELAIAIGKELGLHEDRLEGVRIGAWIHDIGKIGVPTEILSKPGKLDATEIALIKRHAEIGYDIVKNIDFGWPVEKIVHQHHERIDGSGYPQGLKGDQIALEAKIVAVADVVESMGTDRPYRKRIPWQVVLDEILRGRGKQYDELVVDAVMRILSARAQAFGFDTN
ncbi:MAG: HD domain-containing protein [Nisaea sp.]|uniref:HD domain-containing phosphohydrolase n=1 Tax=Nisaea sp. TaxID=2024842 RepID=UPI001B18043A|nr:HD domain-containing phosphohydrolase [Nisaea sp.]MBO6560109.1 HD domain-containing protein [Nisaea sp.]